MISKFPVKREVIEWACKRADIDPVYLHKSFPELDGKNTCIELTLNRVKKLATALRYSYVSLLSGRIIEDKLPMVDFRTVRNQGTGRFSLNLLEQIYFCQSMQEWFVDYLRNEELDCFSMKQFNTDNDPEFVADSVREFLNVTKLRASDDRSYLKALRDALEDKCILVEVSKVVRNTKYHLNIEEFRGFALFDKSCPMIFINANDTLHGQIFTLAHELGHIALQISGVSDLKEKDELEVERWCSSFAAAFLIPVACLKKNLYSSEELDKLVKIHHVSKQALLLRLYRLHRISKELFDTEYAKAQFLSQQNLTRLKAQNSRGGNYYATVRSRLSLRLARALVWATGSGKTSYREAMSLSGISSVSSFNKFAAMVEQS